MNPLREIARINKDLKGPVFIGSVAVFAYVGEVRETRDIDLALASSVSDEESASTIQYYR